MKKIQPKKLREKKSSKTIDEVNIVPLGSRVLIRPFTKEEMSAKNNFGLIMPDQNTKEKSDQGIVLAVGPGDYQDGDLIPTRVKTGDKVLFSKYGFEDVTVNDEILYLIKEENILAIMK